MKKVAKRKRTAAPAVTPAPATAPAAPTVLVLRTVDAERKSYGGFVWPESGPVEAPDWYPVAECGKGLHGWLRGEGAGGAAEWADDRLWQVVEVLENDIVHLGGKVKFPRGVVTFTGSREAATALIQQAYPGAAVIGGTATAGDCGTATAGDRGTATAGDGGTATAGDRGTATAGYRGTATAGDGGTATAGDRGTATAGDGGTATAGERGTATAGDGGTATAGYNGTATAGERGTATAGYNGTATAGYNGTATAGVGGTIVLHCFAGTRYRLVVGYVGEDGIVANRAYKLDAGGKFVEAPPKAT